MTVQELFRKYNFEEIQYTLGQLYPDYDEEFYYNLFEDIKIVDVIDLGYELSFTIIKTNFKEFIHLHAFNGKEEIAVDFLELEEWAGIHVPVSVLTNFTEDFIIVTLLVIIGDFQSSTEEITFN